MRDRVIEIAEQAHALHWRMSGDEGTGDRLAKMVTDVWQAGVVAAQPGRFAVEYLVSPRLRERIDVVDLEDGVVYELKVSPNNAHFEFYKDIFKTIVARDTRLPSLRKFVFLVPESAACVLMRNLAGAVVADAHKLGIEIEIVGLRLPAAEHIVVADEGAQRPSSAG